MLGILDRLAEAALELAEAAEQARVDEGEQAPQLPQVVLDGGAGEGQAKIPFELEQQLGTLGAGILDLLRLVQHHTGPAAGLERLRQAGHTVDIQLDLSHEQLLSTVKGAHALIIRSATDVNAEVPGLMHVQLGDYHIKDIEFVAAFDVDGKKVGLDLADAMWASENNTIKFADVKPLGIKVSRGHTLDGLGRYYKEMIQESTESPVDVVKVLKEREK